MPFRSTHCWSCNHPIDSNNSICPICGWIICPMCGSCTQFGCISYRNLSDSLPQQVSLRKYIRETWTDTPHDKRPRRSELESWTEKIIQGVKIEEQKKQVAAVEEKKRLMKESADFLKFLLTKPRVKNKKSSATGTVSKVSAQKDYKWFNVTVKYSDSTEKNYAPNSKETFYDLFELVADGQE